MESQPQNPEFINNPENFHLCMLYSLHAEKFCLLNVLSAENYSK